jgi:3-methyladenine DNA glycosylase Tag
MSEHQESRPPRQNAKMATHLAEAFESLQEWINYDPTSQERFLAIRAVMYLCRIESEHDVIAKRIRQALEEQYGQMDSNA